jgi:hypothetical protein
MEPKERCPYCGHIINKRKETLFKDMVVSLDKVYKWCLEHNTNEFSRKEIKHLLIKDNEITRFGSWVFFGGILYKREKKGLWGINLKRAKEFLRGDLAINSVAMIDRVNKEVELSEPKTVKQIKGIEAFLDEHGDFVPEYGAIPRLL